MATAAILALALAGVPAHAQGPSVDQLLERVFDAGQRQPTEFSSEFSADLTLRAPLGTFVAQGQGTYVQWRRPGEKTRQRVVVTKLDVPFLLRPFQGYLKKFIGEKVEGQVEQGNVLNEHDVFLLDEKAGDLWVLAGVRHDIVGDFMKKYGRQSDVKDRLARRAIAKWMYTRMRSQIVKPGGPYVFQATIDSEGNIRDLLLQYDWGPVRTKIDYVKIRGNTVWEKVVVDSMTVLGDWGRIEGLLNMRFSNFCFNNCVKPELVSKTN
ncbi:MAG: hypothetical protein HY660_18015 [Armatimonadetes bacterium]|nr:hypothetical protein [Armatimonadota bacterium]